MTPADDEARWMMSLTVLYQYCLPADFQQLRPCVLDALTAWPHTQVCASHTGAPRRNASAIRRDVLSSLVPTDEHGMAFNYAPVCGAETTRRGQDPPGFVWCTARCRVRFLPVVHPVLSVLKIVVAQVN
jgi:hypothetical protein